MSFGCFKLLLLLIAIGFPSSSFVVTFQMIEESDLCFSATMDYWIAENFEIRTASVWLCYDILPLSLIDLNYSLCPKPILWRIGGDGRCLRQKEGWPREMSVDGPAVMRWCYGDRAEETTVTRSRWFQTGWWGVAQCPVKLSASVQAVTDLDSAEQRWSCTGLMWWFDPYTDFIGPVVGVFGWKEKETRVEWDFIDGSKQWMIWLGYFLWKGKWVVGEKREWERWSRRGSFLVFSGVFVGVEGGREEMTSSIEGRSFLCDVCVQGGWEWGLNLVIGRHWDCARKIRGYGDFVGVGGHGLACVTV